jgi:hypothetical protein
MSSITETHSVQDLQTAPNATVVRHHIRLQGAAAALALLIAAVHIVDQGGIPGDKSPTYVGVGYWILELVAVGVALAFFVRPATRWVWMLAFGVGAGPLIGYALSRGPGLPSYTADRGNWSEPLGVISLVAEGMLVLVVLVVAMLSARRSARQA